MNEMLKKLKEHEVLNMICNITRYSQQVESHNKLMLTIRSCRGMDCKSNRKAALFMMFGGFQQGEGAQLFPHDAASDANLSDGCTPGLCLCSLTVAIYEIINNV